MYCYITLKAPEKILEIVSVRISHPSFFLSVLCLCHIASNRISYSLPTFQKQEKRGCQVWRPECCENVLSVHQIEPRFHDQEKVYICFPCTCKVFQVSRNPPRDSHWRQTLISLLSSPFFLLGSFVCFISPPDLVDADWIAAARDLLGILYHKDCNQLMAKYSPHVSTQSPFFINMIKEIKSSPSSFLRFLLNPGMAAIINCPLPVCELTPESFLDPSSFVLLGQDLIQTLDLVNFQAAIDVLEESKVLIFIKSSSSHHITSHHITSHHITSHHITSHHITSHHIT